jgi:hypothetical protein
MRPTRPTLGRRPVRGGVCLACALAWLGSLAGAVMGRLRGVVQGRPCRRLRCGWEPEAG